MSPGTRSSAPSKSRTVLFSLMTAGLVFAVIEATLQSFYFVTVGDFLFRRTLPPIYFPDPVRCYRVRPNLDYVHRTNEFETRIFTNSLGFRTDSSHREYAVDKPFGLFRIVVLGPSFAFGWGSNYEDIFPSLLERELVVPGRRVEVINVGTPSQGMAHQLCWLEKLGYEYKPDLVLQVAYGRTVPAVPSRCPITLECPDIIEHQLVPANVSNSQRFKSYLKRFASVFYGYYAYNTIFRPDPGRDESTSLHQEHPGLSGFGDDPKLIANTYLEFSEQVRRLVGPQVRTGFIFIPFSYAIHPEDVARFSDVFIDDVPRTRTTISRQIKAARNLGVEILDPVPALISAASDQRMYYWLDIHLTPAGNRIVANELIPFVRKMLPTLNAKTMMRHYLESPAISETSKQPASR